MAVLPILTGAGNPLLQRKTKRVPAVTKKTLKLIKDMLDSMEAANGIGLAAPQIGGSERICLATIGGKITALINPDIVWRSEDVVVEEEGCLSLPDTWVQVPRAREIRVTFTDIEGSSRERRLADLDARVVQHEVDHLEGILIVKYAAPATPQTAAAWNMP